MIEPFYIHTISVALSATQNFLIKLNYDDILVKNILSQCLGWERFLWELFGGRKKQQMRGVDWHSPNSIYQEASLRGPRGQQAP